MFGLDRITMIFVIVLMALTAALGFDIWYLKSNIKDLQISIGKYEAIVSVLKENIRVQDEAIKEQNEAVDAFKRDADERAKEASELLAQAKKDAEVNKKKASGLLLQKRKLEDVCKDAERLINEYLGFK